MKSGVPCGRCAPRTAATIVASSRGSKYERTTERGKHGSLPMRAVGEGGLVGLCPGRLGHRWPPAADANAGRRGLVAERQAPDCRRTLFLDARLALATATPRRHPEHTRLD